MPERKEMSKAECHRMDCRGGKVREAQRLPYCISATHEALGSLTHQLIHHFD